MVQAHDVDADEAYDVDEAHDVDADEAHDVVNANDRDDHDDYGDHGGDACSHDVVSRQTLQMDEACVTSEDDHDGDYRGDDGRDGGDHGGDYRDDDGRDGGDDHDDGYTATLQLVALHLKLT